MMRDTTNSNSTDTGDQESRASVNHIYAPRRAEEHDDDPESLLAQEARLSMDFAQAKRIYRGMYNDHVQLKQHTMMVCVCVRVCVRFQQKWMTPTSSNIT